MVEHGEYKHWSHKIHVLNNTYQVPNFSAYMITKMDSLQKTYHKDNINKKYIYLSTTKQQQPEQQKSISVHTVYKNHHQK